METPTYRIRRSTLVSQFEQQFNYPFADGFALVKAQYRRNNGLKDSQCLLDDVRLTKEVDGFLSDLVKFEGVSELLENVKNNDQGINLTIVDNIISRITWPWN